MGRRKLLIFFIAFAFQWAVDELIWQCDVFIYWRNEMELKVVRYMREMLKCVLLAIRQKFDEYSCQEVISFFLARINWMEGKLYEKKIILFLFLVTQLIRYLNKSQQFVQNVSYFVIDTKVDKLFWANHNNNTLTIFYILFKIFKQHFFLLTLSSFIM